MGEFPQYGIFIQQSNTTTEIQPVTTKHGDTKRVSTML